jgi:dynein heavy chain
MSVSQAFQTEVCEKTKAALWTVWVPKSAEVFRRTPPLYINGDAEAYYMSIAILQSNQLRHLVQDSMDNYKVCRNSP